MKRLRSVWITTALFVLCTLPARGQGLPGWYAIERPAYVGTTTNYGGYAPPACLCTTVPTRWESAVPATYTATYAPPAGYVPRMNYAPAVNYVPAAPCAPPRVTYMPVVAQYPAQNYVTYARPANSYAPAPSAGPKVWVHPKVYVEGQPIRNLIRAITP